MTTRKPVDIVPGRLTTITLGYSEVCMYMRVAGKTMQIVLSFSPSSGLPAVQLYQNGRPFSFPLTPSDAGLYRNPDGTFYGYADESAG